MPWTQKQRRLFGAVASGKARKRTGLSRGKARKMLREGKRGR